MHIHLNTLRLIQCVALLSLNLMAQPLHAGTPVPFQAVYDIQFSLEVTPPLASVSAAGVGLATQLGAMKVESIREVVNLATGEGLAQYRYTAANGNVLELELDFMVVPTATGFTSS